ncbi:HAD family hydrolase [Amycolatopsis kentuckyensis]|uniref:HAD family hydrolase n=1 Tax=Amycolatopsis kentuckyensis TaxID=218823 RepID=UPI0035674DD1
MADALIMDLFGVFTRFDNDLVPARLAKHCAEPEAAAARLAGVMARRDVITGRVTLADLHERLAAEHGYARPYADFEEAWLTPYSDPMPGMAELVAPLAKRYRLVLLSNVDAYYWRVVRAMQPELGLFDDVLLSCDLGLAKPDPEIFRRASETALAPPSRCLFVDDTRGNVDAAAALGFRTHWFRDVTGFRLALIDEGFPLPI